MTLINAIQKRKTLVTLHKIVSANKTFGTAFYYQSKILTDHLDQYTETMRKAMLCKINTTPSKFIPHEFLVKPNNENVLLVVFGGDRGFCGSLNQRLAAHIQDYRQNQQVQQVFIFGQKLAHMMSHAEHSNLEPKKHWLHEFVKEMIKSINSQQITQVVFLTVDNRQTVIKNMLPLLNNIKIEKDSDFLETSDCQLGSFGPSLLMAEILLWCARTKKAENLERMLSMTQAAKNCDESIVIAQRLINRLRQQNITQSLLEIGSVSNIE
jgi:F0F1-type ATP synthase gamma subunit